MVCHRCELAVEGILQTAGIAFQKVVTGEIHLEDNISEEQKELLKKALAGIGLELIDNRMSGLIEKIKATGHKKSPERSRRKRK